MINDVRSCDWVVKDYNKFWGLLRTSLIMPEMFQTGDDSIFAGAKYLVL